MARCRASRPGLVAVAAAALVSTVLVGCRPAPTLRVTTYLTGLAKPWDLAFTPAGDLLVTEKAGTVKVRRASGAVRVVGTIGDVVSAGEGGLMGLAVDPAFSTNRRIYVCAQSNRSGSLDVRVIRFRVAADFSALSERADIVTGIPSTGGRHSGCRPRFGPDGRLWIGTGDAAAATVPQDPMSLGGKVLRVDTNGNGVAGNAPAPFDPRIFSYGHRNVQGIAFSAAGRPFSIEHGPDRDDEVNLLVAGANYGWDPRPLSGTTFYDESRPMTDTARHPGARAAVWSSGTPTVAPSGGTFVRGAAWKGWDNSLAVAVLKGSQLRVLHLGGSGPTADQTWEAVTDRGRLRTVVQGPDGALYVAQDATSASVLRIQA